MTSNNNTPALIDVLTFIETAATSDDIDAIHSAIKNRLRRLRDAQAAAVKLGDEVRIADISPKYLCGLSGTVTAKRGARVTVTLDERSTKMLRFKRPYVGDETNHELTGVPASCARPISG